jgi:hypothetical protein
MGLFVLLAAGGCWLVRSNADLEATAGDSGAGADADAGTGGDVGNAGDGGRAEGGPLSCGVGDILCDDFEHGLAGFWQTNNFPLSSTTTIDSTKAAHGKSSMHAHVDAPDGGAMGSPQAFILVDQGTTTPLPPRFFVRFFVNVPSMQLTDTRSDVDALAVLFEPSMDAVELRAAGAAMSKTFELGNFYDAQRAVSATPFPFDAWHCIEWGITPTSMQMWLDDMAVNDLTMMTTVKPINSEMFGWVAETQTLAAPVGQDLWYDEIVISSMRVGCMAFQEP